MSKQKRPSKIKTPHEPEGIFSYGYRKRKRKTDWAGISLGDAFKPTLDYYLRIPAQRLFYKTAKKVQGAAALLAGSTLEAGNEPMTKPQLSPCYTTYPSALAAYAAIGLTGFLEFEERVPEKILLTRLSSYLKDPAAQDHVYVEPAIYQKMAEIVARCVQTRLLLEDLSRSPNMVFVELFRLFAASQQNIRFRSVPEIIDAVILYGDILPDWNDLELHPITRTVLRSLSAVSYPFFQQLETTKSHLLVQLGSDWVRSVCLALSRFLPLPNQTRKSIPRVETQTKQDKKAVSETGDVRDTILRWLEGKFRTSKKDEPFENFRFTESETEAEEADEIAPLDGPNPPSLFDPTTAAEEVLASMNEAELPESRTRILPLDPSSIGSGIQDTLHRFSESLQKAGGQTKEWEDMRSDLVEQLLRVAGFSKGPIEGNPVEGHEVEVRAGGLVAGGEIFDRAVELAEDYQAVQRLIEESQPITQNLCRVLYPNVEQVPQVEQLRTSGSLDPSRLALVDVSQAIFKRYRIKEKSDRRGRPVLLIACDGSGSLDQAQMKMAKLLVAGWLRSTARSEIQVLAGLYHSGTIREGVTGPLVQWMYHPRKTPSTNRKEAVRTLVSLPDTGTGVQSDALSIAFMLEEAHRIARGKMIYLILISDCQWNRSFPNQELEPEDEVYDVLSEAYESLSENLHVTLVALGVEGATAFQSLVDKVILIPDSSLTDAAAVADQIGHYVASCMQERKKILARR